MCGNRCLSACACLLDIIIIPCCSHHRHGNATPGGEPLPLPPPPPLARFNHGRWRLSHCIYSPSRPSPLHLLFLLTITHSSATIMPPHILDFKCALITGSGGGLGFAMAQNLSKRGKKVILAGRTESNLKEAAQKLGGNVPYYVIDTGKIGEIKQHVDKVVKEHPEVDCLINNAGVQRPLEVTKLDLGALDQEIDIVSGRASESGRRLTMLTPCSPARTSEAPSTWPTPSSNTLLASRTPSS